MDKSKFVSIMRKIKYAYGDRFQELENDMLNTWYECLGDFDAAMLDKAVTEYIKANRYPPNICDLNKAYHNMINMANDGWQ